MTRQLISGGGVEHQLTPGKAHVIQSDGAATRGPACPFEDETERAGLLRLRAQDEAVAFPRSEASAAAAASVGGCTQRIGEVKDLDPRRREVVGGVGLALGLKIKG